MPSRGPAGPRRSAIRRAWPPPPTVASTAVWPGRGASRSISSPASTGTWVAVMSRRSVKARGDVGDAAAQVRVVLAPAAAIPDLQRLPGARDHDLAGEPAVLEQEGGDHHATGRVELGVDGVGGEEARELA